MESLTKQFERRAVAFLRRTRLTPSEFGERALGDRTFCGDVRRGRSPTLATADRILAFMEGYDRAHGPERSGNGRGLDRGEPGRRAPMSGLPVMPRLDCENDVGGRFTLLPSGDSHWPACLSAGAVASYASAATPAGAARAAPTGTGDPPFGMPGTASGKVACARPCHPPRRGRSRIRYPCRKAVQRRCGAADRQFYRPSSRCVCAIAEDRARTRGERQTVGYRERRAMSRRFGSPETLG